MNDIRPEIAFFGKLPQFGDFIRFNAGGPEIQTFEEWIQEGLYHSQKFYDQKWRKIYQNSSVYAFVYYPEGSARFLLGTFKPSRDQSGRSYPFVLSLKQEKNVQWEDSSFALPVVFRDFLDQAGRLLYQLPEEPIQHAIEEQVSILGTYLAPDLSQSLNKIRDFLENTSLPQLWQRLFQDPEDPRKYLLLKNLSEILLPLAGHDPAKMSLGLRFPLGVEAAGSPMRACFWIHLSLVMLGNPGVIPTLFWGGADSGPKFLYLFFRPPAFGIFTLLARPENENDNLCKLEEEGFSNVSSAAQLLHPDVKNVLAAPETSLMDLIRVF